MTIVHLLERNAREYAKDIALVEINPEQPETRRATWHEFELVESTPRARHYRREITWEVFNEKANRLANMLTQNGIGKGKKVAILLMNCIDWLPIYFGILKTGALAVPLNFRYSSDEIDYCLELAQADVLIFGPEFIGRVEAVADKIGRRCHLIYLGAGCPMFADDYNDLISECSGMYPECTLEEAEDAAIYFSSGTTGFPKAILHNHESLIHACRVEQAHHGQTRDDCFLCIPPLYHTGAKMHWFGSLLAGSKAVILKGTQARHILTAASQEKCTIVWLLVPWAQDVLNALDRGEISLDEFELSQWRLMHIGAQPVPQSLIHPRPAVRYQLRSVRVHRPRCGAPGGGERPQGGCHRHPRLRLDGEDRGSRRQRGAAGLCGRTVPEGTRCDDLLLPGSCRHRRHPAGWLAVHR